MIDLKKYNPVIQHLCKKHSVDYLYLFGSAASDKLNPNSDVDFLVSFHHMDLNGYFSNYLALKEQLETLFNRKVDLLEEQAIRNPVLKKSIDQTKILIYG